MAETGGEKTQKQGRGCFFYGAITMALVFIGVVAGTYFGIRKGFLTGIANYTSPTPAPIPKLQLSPQERERIARNLAAEAEQAARPGGPGALTLDGQELNVLLTELPDLRAYSEQIYLQPEGDKLKAQMSVPLDQFELWKSVTRKLSADPGKRYLNGTASLEVGITNGAVNVSLADFVANGKNLPEEFIQRVQGQNLAAAANSNAQMSGVFQRIEAITVQDGQVHVKFRR